MEFNKHSGFEYATYCWLDSMYYRCHKGVWWCRFWDEDCWKLSITPKWWFIQKKKQSRLIPLTKAQRGQLAKTN